MEPRIIGAFCLGFLGLTRAKYWSIVYKNIVIMKKILSSILAIFIALSLFSFVGDGPIYQGPPSPFRVENIKMSGATLTADLYWRSSNSFYQKKETLFFNPMNEIFQLSWMVGTIFGFVSAAVWYAYRRKICNIIVSALLAGLLILSTCLSSNPQDVFAWMICILSPTTFMFLTHWLMIKLEKTVVSRI